MNQVDKIFVAGSGGLIGSAIVRRLQTAGYLNIVAPKRNELDLRERKTVENFLKNEKPDFVFLVAARTGGIQENSARPAEFILENLQIQSNVIDLAYRVGIKKLLFLVSSCVYPIFCDQPMKEEYLFTGALEPTNEPFAIAKLAGIKLCQSYNKQYGTQYICAIPSNVYGINDHFGDKGHVLAGLLSRFYQAAKNQADATSVWGSGKPLREFIYVTDVADACLFLMNQNDSPEIANIGTGRETSIQELAYMVKRTVEFKGNVEFDLTKPDGNPRRFLDSSRIKSMGWAPQTSLESGLKTTFEWYRSEFQNFH